jgi:hypothetical protein
MVAYAVELRLSAEVLEQRAIILVCPDVLVVKRKGECATVDQYVFKNVGVLASGRDSVRGQVHDPL